MAGAKGKSGGKREGAGRTKGSKNTLDYGEVRAIGAAKLRVPESAEEGVKRLADRALERIVDVLEERVWEGQARNVMAAATRIREETCGPLTQKVEHKVQLEDLTDEQLEAKYRAVQERIAAAKAPEPEA
jgi:hypothetical protein